MPLNPLERFRTDSNCYEREEGGSAGTIRIMKRLILVFIDGL